MTDDDDDKVFLLNQGIGQITKKQPRERVSSEGDTTDSGNNDSVQEQTNEGRQCSISKRCDDDDKGTLLIKE